MAFTIKTKSDNRQVHSLVQNLADIPGGVTVCVADLVPGTILYEGTPVSAIDQAGLVHVVKTAKVYEAADNAATAYKVFKGGQFKVGDILSLGAGKAAKTITAVDRDSSDVFDTITVDATLGTAVKVGDVLVQAAEAGASAKLKYEPFARTVEFYDVIANDNIWAPAVVIGTFKRALVPPTSADIDGALKGIVLL